MSESRYINTKFWSDNFIVELDPIERYLFLYFLTNEHTNIAGVYELPLRVIEYETGLEREMLLRILDRFKGKINYFEGWIFVKNFSKNQKLSGKNIDIAIKKLWDRVPKGHISPLQGVSIPLPTKGKGKGKGILNIKRAASPQKNMKTYNENETPDEIPSLDSETGELIPEILKAGRWLINLIFWAEKRMGKKFVNYGKQAKYISKMHKANYTPEQMQKCWEDLEHDDFYREKGFDFYDVSNQISKLKKKAGVIKI